MDLLQLRYFCTVARFGSITQAADLLHVSQPSLSKTIMNLENGLGMPLFDRIGRRIYLSARGKAFYDRVKDGLDLIDDAQNKLADSCGSPTGEINLLILAASSMMPELIVKFAKRYPSIHFKLHHQVRHDLRYSEEYDFCVSATPMDYSHMETVELLTEEIVLVVTKDHPLATRREIDLTEAATCNFVTYSRGPSLRMLMDSLCYMAGFTPHIVFEGDSVSTLQAMIAIEAGVALLPLYTFRNPPGNQLVALHIRKPISQRTVNLSWRADKYMSKACELFKNFCCMYFQDYINTSPDHI
jgi:LysR family transcriptional regulator, transcription activator of glutamate synthase operon